MSTRTSRIRTTLASGAVAAAVGAIAVGQAGTAGAAPAPLSAAPRVAAAAVVPTASWQKLSAAGLSGINQPSLLRKGTTLYVAWQRRDSASAYSVRTRTITAAGQLGPAKVAVSNWAGIVYDPALVDTNGGARVIFGGQRTVNPSEFFAGQMAAADAVGTGWSLDANSFGQSTSAADSEGTAAVEWDGDQINAFAAPLGTIVIHQGSDPSSPASNADTVITEPSGSSTYDTAMAVDPSTNAVWVAWYALNSGTPSANGIRYTTFLPTVGTAATAPGSHNPAGSSVQPDQRVAIAGVATGPWVAYTTGYPNGRAVELFNLRTHRALLVPASANSDQVGLAAGPGGRLWVFWSTSSHNVIHAVRTNAAVTRFEPQQVFASPDVATATAGNGTPGPLDLVINAAVRIGSSDDELFYRRIPARFTAVASVTRGVATITVTDAGTPVKGATVKYLTRVAKTAATGKTSISVGTKKGTRKISVSAGGYWSVVLTVKV
jgi:hypothetical protein